MPTWLRDYETMTKLSLDFELTSLDLRFVLLRTLTILDQTLENEIEWPTDDEFEVVVSFSQCWSPGRISWFECKCWWNRSQNPETIKLSKTERVLVKKETSTFSLSILLVCTSR
jgi:hypothetical protein